MYQDDNWNSVEGDELAGFLEQINPIDGKYRTSPASTQVAWRTLPFYETVALIRVKDPNWVNKKMCIYYLTDQGNLFRLNGTSPPIHEVNNKGPIKLNEDNILEYLRFFCFFVRGDEGPFYVAEDMSDPNIPVSEMNDTTRSVVEGTIRPASYEGMNNQGHFLCDAVVYYSNALFIANFAVQPSGMIEMLNDEPIAGDLSSKVDTPIA
ncbi:MAG: hypothetical protein OEY94_04040 [Alphaproteobacteria bacterium]|nr:hypothetical protein [Alphaproteobacteria bacterium]